MILSQYRLRLKMRHLQREHPIMSVVGFAFNVAVSFAALLAASAALYYLLTLIRPV